MMKSITSLFAALITCVCLTSCNDLGSSASAPTDVAVIPGDSTVTVTWTQASGVEYWLMYAIASSISVSNWADLGGRAIIGATSPLIISGLNNGTTYSFTIDARTDGGPGGVGSPSLSAVPRKAGTIWTTNAALTNDLRGVAYGGKFVTVGANGVLYSSPDIGAITPIAWTARTNPIVALPNLNAATYDSSYIVVGDSGAILLSSDAITWTQQTSNTSKNLYAVANNGAGTFVAVGQDGTVISSSGGTAWTAPITVGSGKDLYAIQYITGTWIAVGKDGTLLTSSDAITWTARTSNTAQTLRSITYGAIDTTSTYLLVAVGDTGALVTSSDGITWTAQTPITASNLRSVVYGSQFIAVGDSGGIFTSTNGTSWAAQSSGSGSQLNAITRGSAGYVTVGAAGTNLSAW